MLVLGDREVEGQSMAVRLRTGENLGAKPVPEVIKLIETQNNLKSLELAPADILAMAQANKVVADLEKNQKSK